MSKTETKAGMKMTKYKITASKYINGEYVKASPEEPAIVELPEYVLEPSGEPMKDKDGKLVPLKVDKSFQAVDTPDEKLLPAHAEKKHHSTTTAAQHHGKKGSDSDPI